MPVLINGEFDRRVSLFFARQSMQNWHLGLNPQFNANLASGLKTEILYWSKPEFYPPTFILPPQANKNLAFDLKT